MALEDIRKERLKKLEKLQSTGSDPYPAESGRTHLIGEVLKKFSALAKSKKAVAVAGRIMAKREHGGSTFIDIQDAGGPPLRGEARPASLGGKIQAYFKNNVLGEKYGMFMETVDIGDFLGIEGKLFKTKKGEETIEVSGWQMLAKSLRPLPEKWHGLQDVEERFRKRYLDILMNPEVRERFETRSKIIRVLRDFFEKNGFLEVETPMLHPIPGGALAKPFVTHHNALDIDLYLRIAPELYLKRLLIAGWEKIFEIGKSFRNEGIDASHNPEFTEPECYAAYWDEEDMMKFVEDLFLSLLRSDLDRSYRGPTSRHQVEFEGKKIIFKKPFPRIAFKELLKRYALVIDYDSESRDSLATRARQFGIEVGRHETKGKIADEIYKKICRPHLVQPTFVVNHPLDISPLAKRAKHAGEVRRFQLVAGGMELTNGFAELNDPLDQRKRFEEQENLRGGGEEEAHRIDEDYMEAMEYGMPPAAGLGIGLDRVVMLFTNTKNIREVVLFPTMRQK
ncbi:MAG: lysine--tRNA ligase [Candidatus Sungiibacteriota bacterium]|uniref:Lysine--tRNA ligase n=1 Tax=Candidatus Sungiibacteriota bacterium TaxID=2750080 RepID=A0A7T5US03_9BACT|nr:MAG: lysine--tRNA ligase [Candidatus Sungbacteria bacterium]